MNSKIEYKKLGDIIEEINSGFACNKKNEAQEGYIHLRTNNISPSGQLNLDKLVKIRKEKVDKKKNKLEIGDILFNNTNSKELVGKTCLIKKNYDFAYSNHLTKLKTKKNIEPAYLVYYLNNLFYKGYFLRNCKKWIGQAGFSSTQLKEITIPIIDLEKQKGLVKKLDKIFEYIGLAEEKLQINQNYAHEVLANELDIEFKKLRDSYQNEKVEKLKKVVQYGTSQKTSTEGRYSVLGMANLQDGEIDYSKLKHIDLAKDEASKYILRKGDILFNRTNSFELVGKTSIFEGGEDTLFASYLIRLEVDDTKIDPYYLNYFLNSGIAQKYLKSMANKAVSQANINAKKLQSTEVPLPPLKKQYKLVERFNKIKAETRELEDKLIAKSKSLKELKLSVLNSAFEGAF